jgi:uncharacterized protein YecT (DUF1311 family)
LFAIQSKTANRINFYTLLCPRARAKRSNQRCGELSWSLSLECVEDEGLSSADRRANNCESTKADGYPRKRVLQNFSKSMILHPLFATHLYCVNLQEADMWLFDFPAKLAGLAAALALLTPAMAAGADPKDCMETATTQSQRDQCASTQLKAADGELNRVYKAILKKYKNDTDFLRKLRNAQQAWLKFRDAELEAQFPLADKRARYGSAYPMCANLFLVRRTQERIKDLRQWLDGTEEGNVCAGSVRYKP